tara:strand:- start:1692 stop:2192 length:501 start_codon:yes stop_codon:yes gene_type:complete
MDPITAMAVLSTGLQVFGMSKAAKAEARQAEMQAKQMEIDRKIGEAQALELQNQRIAEYNLARAVNNAQFSFQLGGGESSSLAAFERSQRETLSSDIVTSQRQSFLEGSSRSVAAMISRQGGVNARSAASINSLSAIFDLGSKLAKTYTPTPQPTGVTTPLRPPVK